MNELSIEEKAERYEKAIAVARGNYETIVQMDKDCTFSKEGIINTFHHMFPELKEDEREIPISEQKSAEEYNITGIGSKNAQGKLGEMIKRKLEIEKQCEQKPAEFDDTNAKRMFIKALERVEEQNNKGYKLTDCDKNSWWEDFKVYTTSWQNLANSAKTCKDEQKSAWSEEDETGLTNSIIMLKEGASLHFTKKDITKAVDWLKSLKDKVQPQNTWKPSDDQMDTLLYEVNAWDEDSVNGQDLRSLYQDLKKLKG